MLDVVRVICGRILTSPRGDCLRWSQASVNDNRQPTCVLCLLVTLVSLLPLFQLFSLLQLLQLLLQLSPAPLVRPVRSNRLLNRAGEEPAVEAGLKSSVLINKQTCQRQVQEANEMERGGQGADNKRMVTGRINSKTRKTAAAIAFEIRSEARSDD